MVVWILHHGVAFHIRVVLEVFYVVVLSSFEVGRRHGHKKIMTTLTSLDYIVILAPVIALIDALISLYVNTKNSMHHDKQSKLLVAVSRSVESERISGSGNHGHELQCNYEETDEETDDDVKVEIEK